MADKDKSLMMALGVDPETGEYKKGANENLLGDLAEETKKTIGEEFDQFKEETKKENIKLPILTQLKGASEKSGGNLTSEAALGMMRTIGSTVTTLTQDVEKAILSSVGTVESQLKQTLDLLASPNEEAQDQALDRMESLQKAMGTDFEKITAAMGVNIKDLLAGRQFQREENRKKEELQAKIKEERLLVRDELRERNINTVLDEKTNTLKVQTLLQEKEFKKNIFKDEQKLIEKTKENNAIIKELRKQETLSKTDEQKIFNLKQEEIRAQKDIDKRKQVANIQPTQKSEGFFSQTFGAAIDQAKNTFGELKDMGSSLLKGFKNLPNTIGGFAKGLGRAALAVGTFALKGLAIGIVIGVVIYALYKLYQAFQKAKNFVSNLFSFGKKKEEKGADDQLANTSEITKGDTTNNNIDNKSSTSTSTSTTAGDIKNSTSIENQATDTSPLATTTESLLPLRKSSIQPIPRPINVNKMSADMAAEKESKPSSTVIAPSNSSNVVNNNTTQSISMLPINPDRSFINLNSVAI
jgi:hypothetical protein